MKVHELKCWPEPFQAMWDGYKTFEVRVNDRDYQVADYLLLREFDPATSVYSGRRILVNVLYVMEGGRFGVAEGSVIMSTRLIETTTERLLP